MSRSALRPIWILSDLSYWAILLMEADFNVTNKEIYGVRMMDNARRYKLIPEEIFSEQNWTADDGGLAKTLFYDIARQTRAPAAIASVDASNCYDQIAHAMASLIFQSFGVESTAVSAMLETIQEMKFFLRTAYGDSKRFLPALPSRQRGIPSRVVCD